MFSIVMSMLAFPTLLYVGFGRFVIWIFDSFTLSPSSPWIYKSWWAFQFPGLICTISCLFLGVVILTELIVGGVQEGVRIAIQSAKWWIIWPIGLYLLYCFGISCWYLLKYFSGRLERAAGIDTDFWIYMIGILALTFILVKAIQWRYRIR